jgi:hypothetical protein
MLIILRRKLRMFMNKRKIIGSMVIFVLFTFLLLIIPLTITTSSFIQHKTLSNMSKIVTSQQLPQEHLKVIDEIDEKMLAVVVIFKLNVSEMIAKQIYENIKALCTIEHTITVKIADSKYKDIKVTEVLVSKLVRDEMGHWMFKAFLKQSQIKDILRDYNQYIERIFYKQKPLPMPMQQDEARLNDSLKIIKDAYEKD